MFVRKDGRVTGSLVVDAVPEGAEVPDWVGGVDVEELDHGTGGELAEAIREARDKPAPEPPEAKAEPAAEPAKAPTAKAAAASGGAASVKSTDTAGVAKQQPAAGAKGGKA